MNREELMKIMPHHGSMLLLDEAERREDTAYAAYLVRGDEWFLDGHFPDHPVVPGVVLCEMLAQSACVLLAKESPSRMPLYAGIQNARFRQQVRPGDNLEMETVIVRRKPPFYFAKGTGRVDGKLCVEAEFTFALVENKP